MILDSSAILAIVLREPGSEILIERIAEATDIFIGAPTLAEAGIVLENRLGNSAPGLLVQFLHEWKITILAFGEDHWREAVAAYSIYGKGKHKAGLNIGDCLTFAVARLSGQPLLDAGGGFSKTDIERAL